MTLLAVILWLIAGSPSLIAVTSNAHVGEAVAVASGINAGGLSGWGLTILITIALDLGVEHLT